MSRFDAQHEAAWRLQAEKDAAAFVVGATVYRPKDDRIQSGIVRRVGRCDRPDGNEDAEEGRFPCYRATFLNRPGGREEWASQTFSYRFFATEAEARDKLARDLENRIESAQRDLRRLEALLAAVRAGSPLDTP